MILKHIFNIWICACFLMGNIFNKSSVIVSFIFILQMTIPSVCYIFYYFTGVLLYFMLQLFCRVLVSGVIDCSCLKI